jgi:type VI secretion system secreted protein VgrG
MPDTMMIDDTVRLLSWRQLPEPLDLEDMLLTGFSGSESLSRPFVYRLNIFSTHLRLDESVLVGKEIAWTVHLGHDNERHFSGLVRQFSRGGLWARNWRAYTAEVVPRLWLLSRNADCQIFQNWTVPNIINNILTQEQYGIAQSQIDDLGIRKERQDLHPAREYCVQYRETDFNFISRLMEEEGIYYFFRCEEAAHKMLLRDSYLPEQCKPYNVPFRANPTGSGFISSWTDNQELRSSRWVQRDYNFEDPMLRLQSDSNNPLNDDLGFPDLEMFDFPGKYKTKTVSDAWTDIRMEEEETPQFQCEGQSTCLQFAPGLEFMFTHSEVEGDDEGKYKIIAVQHRAHDTAPLSGAGGTPTYANSFVCMPATSPFRPPRLTPKPVVYGIQTARVVGLRDDNGRQGGDKKPKRHDDKKDTVECDQYGRIKVEFPWDRYGDNSCFLRVAQSLAGNAWGALFTPRVGMEVIVQFLEGDPDRPVVVGALYNGENKPPWALPRYKTRSGIKTRSTVLPPGPDRFHLLRFEDKVNDEQMLLRSQRRLDVTALQSAYHTTHANRHILVGGKDPKTGKSGGALYTTTGGEYDLHVGDNRYEGIDKGYQLSVKTDTIFDLQAGHQTVVGKASTLNAQKVVIEAPIKITLKVGSSFVVLDPAGVYISGPMININSGGSADSTSDADVTDPVDASMADPGDPSDWLEKHRAAGSGGGRRHHIAKAQHGLAVTRNKDGSFQVTPGIQVRGTPDYVSRVVEDLATIDSTKDGQDRLSRIDGSGRQVTIQNYDASNPKPATPNADTIPGNNTVADYQNAAAPGKVAAQSTAGGPITDAAGNPVLGNGKGTDSTVHYDPNDWPDPNTRTKAPGDAILNHELGHADNQTHGRQDMTANNTDGYGTQEEFNNLPNDNAYRRERGIPERKDYSDF